MLQEKIKNIVSLYIKVPENEIGLQTIIDRTAVGSSIILHRMYAHLAKEKIIIENYWDIKVFGDLLHNLKGEISITETPIKSEVKLANLVTTANQSNTAIGIDIEETDQFPKAADFRTDSFYLLNFSSSEIAYCLLQPNTIASFAGLFAIKEAIVKADNTYRTKAFNTIIIHHLPEGKPMFPSFEISISHTPVMAVAIAIKNAHPIGISSNVITTSTSFNFSKLLSIVAIIISIAAIIICVFR